MVARARIELAEPDHAWPDGFADEAARLAGTAPALTWHHIGSTAVPGLVAKPIIDMMALADDIDGPVPALVEQGGYQFPTAYNGTLIGRRWLCRPSRRTAPITSIRPSRRRAHGSPHRSRPRHLPVIAADGTTLCLLYERLGTLRPVVAVTRR